MKRIGGRRNGAFLVIILVASVTGVAPAGSGQVGPRCRNHPATIVGTDQADALEGTPGRDVIVAGRGNDIIDGKGGRDIICANEGHDTVYGRGGNDIIDAGPGDDVIFAGRGEDRVSGQSGTDLLEGGAGDDRLRGGPGPDTARGQGGHDHCRAEIRRSCEAGETTAGPPTRLKVVPSSIGVEVTSPTSATLRFRTNVCATARHRAEGDTDERFLNPAITHTVVHTGGNFPVATPCWIDHRVEFGVWTPALEPCGHYVFSSDVRDSRGQRASVGPLQVAIPCPTPATPVMSDLDIAYETPIGTVWSLSVDYDGAERVRLVFQRVEGVGAGQCLIEEFAIDHMWWWVDGETDRERLEHDRCGYRADVPWASGYEGFSGVGSVLIEARAIAWDGQESAPSTYLVDWDYCRDVPDGC